MKKLLIVFSLTMALSILAAGSVSSEKPYKDISNSFFAGLKSGDYSKFESYLSSEMRKAFDNDKFIDFRKSLFSSYGLPDNYRFIREKRDEFIQAYYELPFEKAVLTFRLVFKETELGFELAGIQITDVVGTEKGSVNILVSNLDYLAFPIIGSILAFLLFYILGFKDIKILEILMGALLAIITVLVQPNIQNLPFGFTEILFK